MKDKIIHTQFNVIDDDIIEPKELRDDYKEGYKQAIINFKEVLLKKFANEDNVLYPAWIAKQFVNEVEQELK